MLSNLHVFSSHWSFGMGTVIVLIRQMKRLGLRRQHAKGPPFTWKEEELRFEPRSI